MEEPRDIMMVVERKEVSGFGLGFRGNIKGRIEGRVNWLKVFLGFWSMDGETLARTRGPARSSWLCAEIEVPLRPPGRNVWEAAGQIGQVLSRAPDCHHPDGHDRFWP